MKKSLFNFKTAALALGLLISGIANAQFTAVSSGDWSNSATWGGTAPTGTVTNQNITIPTGITVNMDMDVTYSGLLNAMTVNGILTSTSSALMMTSGNLAGTGTVSVNKLKFSSIATTSYAGNINVKSMVNSVTSSLAFASVANITDTLELDNGTISLNTNGNLTMASGSTIKVNNGSIAMNSGIFNSGNSYNVMYVGTTKNAGVELNSVTVQNVYINMNDNTQSVMLNNNLTINANLKTNTGMLDLNGYKLTLKGDLMMAGSTTLKSNNTSSMEVQGTGALTSNLMFTSGSNIKDFTINRSSNGMVKLSSGITFSGHLYLMDGTLSVENSGTLIANTSATVHVEKGTLALNSGTFMGSPSYNVEYAGTTDASSGAELNASGLNNVTVNYSSNTNKVSLSNNLTVTGKLNMMSGKMDLNGKTLMLNGTFNQTNSSWFIGSTASELQMNLSSVSPDTIYFDNANANSQTLNRLVVNTAGVGNVVLGSKLIINTELQFIKNSLVLGNGDLVIMPSASITGYDDTKYVITSDMTSGTLIQNVNSGAAYVTFPIGLASDYSPVYVQQTSSGTSGNFSAKCNTLSTTGNLKAVNRTWLVENVNATSTNANIRFGWKATAEVNSFDRTNAYVSHYTNNAWDVVASSSASVGVYSTFELSRTGLTSLSPFAVVQTGQPLGIKEVSKELSGVELYPNPAKDVIQLKMLNTGNEYQCELIDVTGRTISSTSTSNGVNKFDVSGLGAGCYFIKITSLNDNKTTTKRFIKQ